MDVLLVLFLPALFQKSFGKLLAHIAPENVSNTLKEVDIAAAMQMYNLERAYAINALTISNELISLRRNQGLDVLQALSLLQQRVSAMRSLPYRPPSSSRGHGSGGESGRGASASGGGGAAVSSQHRQLGADEDRHVEKRRRLSKSCSCDAGTGAPALGPAVGLNSGPGMEGRGGPLNAGASSNDENVLRAEKRAVSGVAGSGSSEGGGGGGGGAAAAGSDAGSDDMADFKRSRREM